MIAGIGNEAAVFLYAVLSGAMILLGYCLLGYIRRMIRHSMLAVGVEDLIFWIGASIYLFRRMYLTSYGRIRWYFIFGAVIGAGAAGMILRLSGKIYIKAKKRLEKYREKR